MIYSSGGGVLGIIGGEGGGSTPSSRVIVNGDSDLPDLVLGYSPLAGDTEYFFQNNVTITKPLLIAEEGTSFLGAGPFGEGVIYTGTLPLMTIDNVSVSVDKLAVNSDTASQFVDGTGIGTNTFFADTMNFEGSSKLGTFDGISPVFNNLVAVGFSDGFTFASVSDDIRGASVVNAFMVDDLVSGAHHFRLNDVVLEDFEIQNVIMDGTGVCISTTVGGSANMVANTEADVMGTTFGKSGFMTPLSGFTDDWQTNQWQFSDNSPLDIVETSRYFVDQYLLTTNNISVASSGAFYEIGVPGAGAWDSEVSAHFTPNADGSITYDGDKDIFVEIIATATIEKVGGGSDELEGRIAINWTVGGTGEAKSKAITQNNQPTSVTMTAAVVLSPMDNIRLIFSNNTGKSNIIVDVAKMDIGGQ